MSQSERSDSFSSFYSDELITVEDLVKECKNLTLDQINNNNISIPKSKPETQESSSERDTSQIDEGCPAQPLANGIGVETQADVGENDEQREMLIEELVEAHSLLQRTLDNKRFLEEILEEKIKARFENGVELSFADMRKKYAE